MTPQHTHGAPRHTRLCRWVEEVIGLPASALALPEIEIEAVGRWLEEREGPAEHPLIQ